VIGNLTVNAGAGFSTVHFDSVAVHGNLSVTTASLADQKDDIDIFQSILFGTVTMNLGAGSSLATVDDSYFFDNVTMNLGAGTDVLQLDMTDVNPGHSSWYGLVKINLGAGDDSIDLGGTDPNTGNIFAKAVQVDGGAGNDLIGNHGNTFLVGTGPVLAGFP